MNILEIVLFCNKYYCRVIYLLAAYIADYEEQALLSCIVRNWCAKCLAHHDNLDEDALLCHREHVSMVINEFDLCKIWETYGINGDVLVSASLFSSFSVTN